MISSRPEHGREDQERDREQELVLSPERLEWLQDLQRRVGELSRDTPPKAKKRRGGTWAAVPPRRPGHRPRR